MSKTVKHKLISTIDSLVTSCTVDDLGIPDAAINQLKNKQGLPERLLLKDGGVMIITPVTSMRLNFGFGSSMRAIKDVGGILGIDLLTSTHHFTISDIERGTHTYGVIYRSMEVLMVTQRTDEQCVSHCEVIESE